MKKFIIYVHLLTGLALPTLCWADQFKLYLDNSHTKHIMVEEQDCSIYKTRDGRITIGFKAGNLLFEGGPEITFGRKSGIDWDRTVHSLIARYQELCTRFNTGALTKQEYDKRLREIENIEREAYTLYQKMVREKAQRRQALFDELDRETGRNSNYRHSVSQINQKLHALQQEIPISNKSGNEKMTTGYLPGTESHKDQPNRLKKVMEGMEEMERPSPKPSPSHSPKSDSSNKKSVVAK
jgi:chaperonin cofactor prefoldin